SYPPSPPMPAAASWGQKRYGLRRTPASLEQKSASLLSWAWFDPPDYLAAWKNNAIPKRTSVQSRSWRCESPILSPNYDGPISRRFSKRTCTYYFVENFLKNPSSSSLLTNRRSIKSAEFFDLSASRCSARKSSMNLIPSGEVLRY